MNQKQKHIIIVGGGFAGIRCALDLAKKRIPDANVILISDTTHFEYHAALYKIVFGASPFEVCIPLNDIFEGKPVQLIQDKIEKIDHASQKIFGSSGSAYAYDYLVLAVGNETAFFDIPGLADMSYVFKSINDALKLKNHIHDIFQAFSKAELVEKLKAAHFVVVGGGATGCELAGGLAWYARDVAKRHHIDPSLITIDLIEAAPRLLPMLHQSVSRAVYTKLHGLGVNIFLNRTIVESEISALYMDDMRLETKTILWTAGSRPNSVVHNISGFVYDKRGRVHVDNAFAAKNISNVFVVGDIASTKYSGMAQSAIAHGSSVASVIASRLRHTRTRLYAFHEPYYVIPVGRHWAAAQLGNTYIFGRVAWWLRNLVDFRYLLSILPFRKAYRAFTDGNALCETCPTCTHYQEI